MTETAIHVEGLGKQYRLGERQPYKTLREAMRRVAAVPVRALRGESKRTPHEEYVWALRNVSFDLPSGQVLGVIGRNGAGKSTLLKLLSRITEPTEGRASIYGRVGSLLEVGTGFHPELTGRENVYLNGAILGMQKADIAKKFDEIVEFAEVERFLDTPVKRYSSGMYVRLAFAVAAHLEPEILIVDEVLAVGDAAFQKKCLGKMQQAAHQGQTVIFVSHNMHSIREMCHTAIWLDQGTMRAQGTVDAIVDEYLKGLPRAESLDEVQAAIAALPPDRSIRLLDVGVSQGNVATANVNNGEPVDVKIEYEVTERTPGLRVYMVLYDQTRLPLFRSFAHGDADELPVVEPGHYVSTVTIPPDLLAPVDYEVGIGAAVHNVRRCFPDEITLPLHVSDSGHLKFAYAHHGPIPFRLAPVLAWETEAE